MPGHPPESLPAPLSLGNVLDGMAHHFEKPLPRTTEVVLAGLLAQPELAVCTYRGQQLCKLEAQERQTALESFLAARRDTDRRLRTPHLYVIADEIRSICLTAGWRIPPMFPIRIASRERNRELDAQTRSGIVQAAGLPAGSDTANALLEEIETAVNWYRCEPLFKEGLPTKPQAREQALAIIDACTALQVALTDLHDDLRLQVNRLMRTDWERDPDALGPLLHALEQSAVQLKAHIEVRMPNPEDGRPEDNAARLLAREVATALHKAGVKVSATRYGRFEEVLRHALQAGGAGTANKRVHDLAMHAVADHKAQLRGRV